MAEFAKYYVEFLWLALQNAWYLIKNVGEFFYRLFVGDAIGYFNLIAQNVGKFNAASWVLLVIVSIMHILLAFFILYKLFQLIRRYFIFRSKEIEKDKLLEEIARLHEESERLIKEKDQLFSLKVGKGTSEIFRRKRQSVIATERRPFFAVDKESRFTRLIEIDERYENFGEEQFIFSEEKLSLSEIVDRFVNFAASNMELYYSKDIVRLFFAGMATSKIIIMEGISGTGKTSLPYAMGKFFDSVAPIISVQPSFRDRAELLGYFNEFTKKFKETDFLSGLYEATFRKDPDFIVLDEMNLARIEYYFADFLSIMEMPDVSEWTIDLVPAAAFGDPKNLNCGKLLVPQNVWFIGTANNDDSTFTITDKVYDRAVAIALNEKADYFEAPKTEGYKCSADYIQSLFDDSAKNFSVSEKNMKIIKEMDEYIQKNFRVSFGNRTLKQLSLFVPAYMACGGDELDGIDFIITTKVLRKFFALNLPFLTKELQMLIAFLDRKFGKGRMKTSIEYLRQLQKTV